MLLPTPKFLILLALPVPVLFLFPERTTAVLVMGYEYWPDGLEVAIAGGIAWLVHQRLIAGEVDGGEARVEERVDDYREVYQEFPERKLRAQASRCMDCGVPFCHTGCPVNNIIPDWNDLVYKDRWKEAILEDRAKKK